MLDSEFEPQNETDEDLVVFMSWKSDNPGAAQAAFAEFHTRHVRYLYAVCLEAYADDIGHGGVEDLVQETFWRAFEKADTFTPMSGEEDAARRRIRAWLGRIAYRLVLTAARRQKRCVRLVTSEEERVDRCPDRTVPRGELTLDEELVRRGMNELLNERERQVLESFASYYDVECKHQYPPDGLVAELCERLGTTEENVRQIRSRALKALKEFIIVEKREIERVKDNVPR
jgi:RNA polymerase sigma factor (sigma-70 family)